LQGGAHHVLVALQHLQDGVVELLLDAVVLPDVAVERSLHGCRGHRRTSLVSGEAGNYTVGPGRRQRARRAPGADEDYFREVRGFGPGLSRGKVCLYRYCTPRRPSRRLPTPTVLLCIEV